MYRDSARWVTSTSVSGRSTSSNTRCSGSANDVAVYCIRGRQFVGAACPQRQRRPVAGRRRERHLRQCRPRPPRRPPGPRRSARARSTRTRPGSRITAPKSVNPTSSAAGSASSTRRNAGATTIGATASTTHAAAAIVIPASMVPGASRASAAGSERGRARNPMPNALTIAATPRPVVSATAPTASGAVSATSVSWLRRGVDQRLDQQPLADETGAQRQPGRAERGHPEQDRGRRHPCGPARRAGRGHAARSPPAPTRRPEIPGS